MTASAHYFASERNLSVWRMRRDGKTLLETAKAHGITQERVRQICLRIERATRCEWRNYYAPAEILAHDWTPEKQRAEFEAELVR